MPGILSQMGPEALNSLRQIAESYQAAAAAAGGPKIQEEEDDEDVPELVENFEEAAKITEEQ
jgi:nascent polypeptide-associated complex subunit beta